MSYGKHPPHSIGSAMMAAMRMLAACLVTLAATPAAAAHITAVPPFARAGAEARLVLDVINERTTHAMTELRVRVPAGMTVRSGERLGRWQATFDEREVRWVGGALAPNETERFALLVTAPPRPGAVELEAVQHYPDGGRTPWAVALTITPGAAADGDDQHLGAAAVVAIIGLAALVTSLLVVHRLRRGRLQER